MKCILQSIHQISPVSDEVLSVFAARLRPLKVAKRTILISPQKKDNNIYFIEKGISRSYTIREGREMTSWFSKEGEVTFSTNSFYGKMAGYENEQVQVLEDSLFYYMPICELEGLCQTHIEIANWLRILHQKAFVEIERRLIFRLYHSAEDRYREFAYRHPDLFQRVNLGHIASYLGISHVTLCALRKQELRSLSS
ncbi:MAG: Crp/Fnr family transcriptional regulator [Bacteroidales bacterium]